MEARKSKIFISCPEAKQICDKTQYYEASWWDHLRLGIRLLYCNVTQEYVAQNKKITNLVSQKDVVCMNKSVKEKLKEKLQKELQNNP